MSKKTKITFTLSAIVLALGIGAQFYTNHKVDQVLQNFPYLLDNQALLQVTENNKNFFSRDLTFSLQSNDAKTAESRTNVISTKLTALPFFITAESQLSDELVRQLNKTLNITLDKNTINSKFSPVGDYLQTEILTEFRDFTNKSQSLSLALHFLKNKDVELKVQLSGFNYDKGTKFEQINGEARLIPVNQNQYDVNSLDLTAKNAEIELLNGENTRIYLKNATYNFASNAETNGQKRALNNQFSSDILRIANKTRTTDDSQTTIGGFNLFLKQTGVPSTVNFYNEFKKLQSGSQSLKDGVNFFTKVLTENEQFDGKLSVLSVNAPKNQQPYFNLQNAQTTLKLANTDLTKANLDFQLNVENVKQTPANDGEKWEAKEGKISLNLQDYNLANELTFVPFFLDAIAIKDAPEKDSKTLLAAKEKWAKEYQGKTDLELSLKAFNYDDQIVLTGFKTGHQFETLNNDQYNENSTSSLEKLGYLKDAKGLQFEDIKMNLPVKGNHRENYLSAGFCRDVYALLCDTHLTKATFYKYIQNSWKDLDWIVDDAGTSFNINTYPETKAYPVKVEVNGIISRLPEDQIQTDFLQNMQGTLNIMVNKYIVDESDEKILKIREQNQLWKFLRDSLKPNGKLYPGWIEENDDYVLKIEKNEQETLINGKTPEDIRQELMIEDDGEPVETLPSEE